MSTMIRYHDDFETVLNGLSAENIQCSVASEMLVEL